MPARPASRRGNLNDVSARFRIVAAAIGALALILQYLLVLVGDLGPGPLGRTVNFFSYFTILSNILIVLALAMPSLAPHTALARFFMRPQVRAAIVAYVIVVAITYDLVLSGLLDLQGLARTVDIVLHDVMPFLFVLDWLLLVPKGALRFREIPAWLVFPAIYLAWTFLHGALSGFYPYPFVDAGALGYARAGLNVIGLFALFLLLGIAMTTLDHLLARLPARPRPHTRAQNENDGRA
jgi:hypothetical protein